MGLINRMVREGYDRIDLYELPQVDLVDWYNRFRESVEADNAAIEKANKERSSNSRRGRR